MKTTFDKSRVSSLLQTLRLEKNVTQATLAKELGFSDKTYSRWETGDALPDLESLSLLADYFGVSPSLFFEENDSGSIHDVIQRIYSELSPAQQVDKMFEILFHTIRGIAENAINDIWNDHDWDNDIRELKPPENRVWQGCTAKTGISYNDVYAMMYNGSDANIALSIMPHEEKYAWLTEERDMLSSLLSLLADRDMLAMLPHILSKAFTARFTAEYVARCAGIETDRAEVLLNKAQELKLCVGEKTLIGDAEVTLYTTNAEHTLTGLLTLSHLILSDKINGCVTINAPGKITCGEGHKS